MTTLEHMTFQIGSFEVFFENRAKIMESCTSSLKWGALWENVLFEVVFEAIALDKKSLEF